MIAALGFLTPFGPARTPHPGAVRWFPVVGLAVGAAVGAAWWAGARGWHGSLVAAGLAVTADLVLTGMLHVDGLADSADGLLPHLGRERRLQVMAEPDVGAFGLAATVGALLLRFAAFGALRPDGARVMALVAGLWCLSRSLMVAVMALLPYARPTGGLATAFLGGGRTGPALAASGGMVVGAALAVWGRGVPAAVGVVTAMAATGAVAWLARRRLGGFTGDVLGAVVVVSETVALVVSGSRW